MSENSLIKPVECIFPYIATYYSVLCQCREEGACALENASESREVEPISSDLRSEATEEEGIGSTSRDEDAFSSV